MALYKFIFVYCICIVHWLSSASTRLSNYINVVTCVCLDSAANGNSNEADGQNVSTTTQNCSVTKKKWLAKKRGCYICSVCNKQCARLDNLKMHLRQHTGEKPFGCETCGKCYAGKHTLELHRMTHATEKRFSCSRCDMCYLTSDRLQRHMNIHTDKYKCPECEKCFYTKCDLLAHSQSHSGVKLFGCKVCDKQFTRVASLAKHVRIHYGPRPYVCTLCSKDFTRSDILQSHMRIHTREKKFECSVCEKLFLQPSQLLSHKRIHNGTKPYKCMVCSSVFRTHSDLRSHTFVHLKGKPIECPRCKNTYAHALSLRRHRCYKSNVPPHCRPDELSSRADGHNRQEQTENMRDVAANEPNSGIDGQGSQETDASETTRNTQKIADSMCTRIMDVSEIVIVLNKLIHQCPYCVEKFKCKGNLQRHVRCSHAPAKL